MLPAFWETCMQVKKQQLEPDMEQGTGSMEKESIKDVGKKIMSLHQAAKSCSFVMVGFY